MTKVRILLIGALLLFLIGAASAQYSRPPFGHPWEYRNLCWKDEQKVLNHFAQVLKSDPARVGYIVVYAGPISCPDEAKYRAQRAKKWVVNRGVNAERVITKDGGYMDELQTVLHVQDRNDPVYPSDASMFTKQQVSISRRCVGRVFELKLCPDR